jgi:hypothetical protein
VCGHQRPGSRLLLALASLPGVNRKWALLGKGQPPDPDDAAATELSLPVVEDFVVPFDRRDRERATEFRRVSAAEFSKSRLFLRASAKSIPVSLLDTEFRSGDLLVIETKASLWRKEPKRIDGKFCLVQLPVETPQRLTVARIAVGNSASGKPVSLVMLDAPMAALKPPDRIWRYVDVPKQEVTPSPQPEQLNPRTRSKDRQSLDLSVEVAIEQIVGLCLQLVRIL